MNWRDYYLQEVYPKLALPLVEKYPLVSLTARDGQHPLGEHPLLMLVALTGTGKSTALSLIQQRVGDNAAGIIPTRREVADWIAIPLAQALADEPIVPVPDRVQRFAKTGRFAAQVEGGMAAAFSWLNLADDHTGILLSEGIRGENEIRYALAHFPRWQIVELTLNPLTRLRRLSGRKEDFDRAFGTADLSFLPPELQAEAQVLFDAGEISEKALTITRAETANYGLLPFTDGGTYSNYHRVDINDSTAEEVADAVIEIMQRRG